VIVAEKNGALKLRKRDLIAVVFIAGGFFALTNFRMNSLADDVDNCKKTKEEQSPIIASLQKDVENINKEVGELKTGQKNNTKLLYRILGKLENEETHRIDNISYAGERPIIE
jgi:hypothetical protein